MDVVTGQLLGQYLIKQGFRADVAEHMAVEAARLVIGDNGLHVSADEVSA